MSDIYDLATNGQEPLRDKRRVVCPICLRPTCAMFRRLSKSKYSGRQLVEFFLLFHKRVCVVCKRCRCPGHGSCTVKKFDPKKRRLPAWWEGTK